MDSMIQGNKRQDPIYSLFLCSVPGAGHLIPLLRFAVALQKKGHKITFATSYYEIAKLRQKYPSFQFVQLQDQARDLVLSKMKIMGPPLHLFYQTWYPDLEKQIRRIKPDAIVVDIFSIAAMEIAQKERIKLVVNINLSADNLSTFGMPNMNHNFSFLGLTVMKPNWLRIILSKKNKLAGRLMSIAFKHMNIVQSFPGFDHATSLPPNFKLVGLNQLQDKFQEFPEDLLNWINTIKSKKLDIIYVTFGSMVTATESFISFLYYGLKKTGHAVIWGLKDGILPQDNLLFYVRKWLPQKELLELPEVKVVITHCGFGGVTECISAQKPMLAMPVFGDQPLNAQKIQQLGLGLVLRKSSSPWAPKLYDQPKYTHEELILKVNKVITDPEYTNRVRKLKKIGMSFGGMEKACQWVQYAIEYGYEHLVDKSLIKISQRNPLNIVKYTLLSLLVGGVCYFVYQYAPNTERAIL